MNAPLHRWLSLTTLLASCTPADPATSRSPLEDGVVRVLRVGLHAGMPGDFASIQAAVNAARPGDWILIGPGDYRETGAPEAGVLISTPGLHLRGLDRNRVIVDGTRGDGPPCSADPAAQNPGPLDADGNAVGRNGIEVLGVDGVSVENLTVCNFLSGSHGNGNGVWFNGGDGSGMIGMGSFRGAWLTASTTWFDGSSPSMAMYGVFASNSRGPGVIESSYASNMADSSFYVGACPDCNTVLRRVHAENSALGYSGSNSGGHLVIEDSEWNDNRAGIVPNSLANDDPPSPQDGACPDDASRSCTLIQRNFVHHNNNANTPAQGLTAGAPVGTGIEVSGGRNDTVRENRVESNGAWGILVHDYPDTSAPAVPAYCTGGIPGFPTPLGPACYFVAFGNRIVGNRLIGNGSFGNPTNGDLADSSIVLPPPFPSVFGNCFHGNSGPGAGLTSDPPDIQARDVLGTCGVPGPGGDTTLLFVEIGCAAFGPASGLCPDGSSYPQPTGVVLKPIPRDLPSMRQPCAGVPPNVWCGEE